MLQRKGECAGVVLRRCREYLVSCGVEEGETACRGVGQCSIYRYGDAAVGGIGDYVEKEVLLFVRGMDALGEATVCVEGDGSAPVAPYEGGVGMAIPAALRPDVGGIEYGGIPVVRNGEWGTGGFVYGVVVGRCALRAYGDLELSVRWLLVPSEPHFAAHKRQGS